MEISLIIMAKKGNENAKIQLNVQILAKIKCKFKMCMKSALLAHSIVINLFGVIDPVNNSILRIN